MLLEAARLCPENVVFLLVGGTISEQKHWEGKIKEMGLENRVFLIPRLPPSKIGLYLASADALVSPRLSGTNTHLKIYSYLRSGKPIVTTDLWTHTQVLNANLAILVKPEPEDMARGIKFSLFDPQAKTIARQASEFAQREYTPQKYYEKIELALKMVKKINKL